MRTPSAARVSAASTAMLAALTATSLAAAPAQAATRAHVRAHVRHACCRVAAGTPVEIALVDQVSTDKQKRGDTFAIRLAAPLIVNGQVLLRAGALGEGEVIDSAKPGLGGKPATMVIAADYLESRHRRVPLNAAQLAANGHDNSTPAMVLKLGGLATAPLGIVGIIVPGGGVTFKPGTVAIAKLATEVTLPSLGRATRRQLAAAAAATPADDQAIDASAIGIAPPPSGLGQVVFFRPKSVMGTGQWFNVRENGQALGKLSNGAYFIQTETPGPHSYTAVLEPELKDKLTLRIDAGQTYFVEGTLTAGLVLSAADLQPSSVDKFNKSASKLKLAAASADDKATDAAASSDRPADAASSPAPSSAASSTAPATNGASTP